MQYKICIVRTGMNNDIAKVLETYIEFNKYLELK